MVVPHDFDRDDARALFDDEDRPIDPDDAYGEAPPLRAEAAEPDAAMAATRPPTTHPA